MKKHLRKSLSALLAILFLVGAAGMFRSLVGYRQGAQDYSAAEELAGLPKTETPLEEGPPQESLPEEQQEEADPHLVALLQTDLSALQAVNSEVIGWIQIPETELSYPLLQGTDNAYYLDYTWQKAKNAVGSIFMDYRNDGALGDFHTIIYGHNMKDGSMFGHLHDFKDSPFLEQHPCIYVLNEQGCRVYRIFAVYEASVSTAEAYQLDFANDDEKQAFIDKCLSLSIVDTQVIPTIDDRIVTLSTCTGRGYSTRWVVQAVLAEEVFS